MGILAIILYFAVGLFILFIVISSAVKHGINNSIVGRVFEEKHGTVNVKKSFFDDDLDRD